MFRKKPAVQEVLFIPGKLSDFIPEDHVLKRVNRVLDLSWLDEEMRGHYHDSLGRPCIEPERAVRLMLAGFLHGVVEDRRLMREAQVNIAYRWFAGYDLDSALPDHSSLTRIRQRWGEEKFREIFERTVKMCADAGMVGGDMVHCDATLVRANVSWESLVATYVEQSIQANPREEADNTEAEMKEDSPILKGIKRKVKGKVKKRSRTDPEASMATSSNKIRLEPTYKQHTAVDDLAGIVVDVEVTTGETNEGSQLMNQLERVEATTGKKPKVITCDRTYGSANNYLALEQQGIEALIPPQKAGRPTSNFPLCRFAYDAKNQVVRCPAGKILTRAHRSNKGWFYQAKRCDCASCRLRQQCVPASCRSRIVLILDGYCALVRARRKKAQGWDDDCVNAYKRHRYQVEGVHGEAKTVHGMRRAVRRGTCNMRIQSYLTNAAINLKRLASHAHGRLTGTYSRLHRVLRRLIIRIFQQMSPYQVNCLCMSLN